MIVVEDRLNELFATLPNIKGFKPRFDWGSQNALNLFLSYQKNTNKYPLIWLVESEDEVLEYGNKVIKQVRLIIAKNSEHPQSTNPTIWNKEYKEVLNPLLDEVIKVIERSKIAFIVDGNYKITRKANYTENNKEQKTIDNWNVIILDLKINFNNKKL